MCEYSLIYNLWKHLKTWLSDIKVYPSKTSYFLDLDLNNFFLNCKNTFSPTLPLEKSTDQSIFFLKNIKIAT